MNKASCESGRDGGEGGAAAGGGRGRSAAVDGGGGGGGVGAVGRGWDGGEGGAAADGAVADAQDLVSRLRKAKTIAGTPFITTPDVEERAENITDLVEQALDGGFSTNRGTCLLIIGPKGTGKSSFLQALPEAIEDVYKGRCRTTYMDMSGDDVLSPLKIVDDLINDGVVSANTRNAIDRLNDKLSDQKQCLLLLLDEYQAVYAERTEIKRAWHDFLYNIPNHKYCNGRRRVFAVVSGSSAWLRTLAFGKALRDDVVQLKFPGYRGLAQNLNDTKYRCVALAQMSEEATRDVVKQIIGLWQPSKHIEQLLDGYDNDIDAIATDAYFVTGGVIGQIEAFLMGGATSVYDTLKTVSELSATPLLQALVKLLRERITHQPAKGRPLPRNNALYMTPMSRREVMAAEGDVKIQDLYEAADRNHVIFNDATDKVQFKSPCVAALLLVEDGGDEGWLTIELKRSLTNLGSTGGILAEEAFRRAMADKLERDQDKTYAVLRAGKSLEKWAVSDDCEANGLDSYIFKEDPDRYGADATWFEKNGDGTLRMVRCQIKLGGSKMSFGPKDKPMPTSIADKFKTNDYSSHAILKLALWSDHVRELCKQEGGFFKRLGVTSVESLFVYTRPLAKEKNVQALAKEKDVALWDKKLLAETVWPRFMLEWAKRCNLDIYYVDDGGKDG